MPPKAKITKEMILEAAFEIARQEGAEKINARTISQKLGCSTQPVMYYFKKVSDIKEAAYKKADEFHSAYITDIRSGNPMKEIGLLYIRFGAEERNLFRFLFQSGEFSGKSLSDLTDAAELQPVLEIVGQTAGVSKEQAKSIFSSIFLFAHGYASLFANNSMEYNEDVISADLERIFIGAVYASREKM